MKVLFVSNDPGLFDTGSAVFGRMRQYASAIGELHIISAAPHSAKEINEGALHIYPVVAWRLFRTSALAKRARALILQHGIEVVSAQDPFETGLAALRAAEGTTAKLHIQIHTDFLSPWFIRSGNWRSPKVRMPLLNRYRRTLADRVLPKVSGIRVVSERIKSSLEMRYGAQICTPVVIPISVDISPVAQAPLPAHQFKFSLITVGRLEPEKRIEDILEALKLVQGHYAAVGLFIVGSGREEGRLKKMVHTLGLSDCVIFLGNRPDARGLMQSAQAFIQASAYEGYGLTLVEAALARIPIITTDVGIVAEVFKGYEDVLAAPVADPTALSLHIVGLLNDTEMREALPRHAEATVQAHLVAQGDIVARIAADLAACLSNK